MDPLAIHALEWSAWPRIGESPGSSPSISRGTGGAHAFKGDSKQCEDKPQDVEWRSSFEHAKVSNLTGQSFLLSFTTPTIAPSSFPFTGPHRCPRTDCWPTMCLPLPWGPCPYSRLRTPLSSTRRAASSTLRRRAASLVRPTGEALGIRQKSPRATACTRSWCGQGTGGAMRAASVASSRYAIESEPPFAIMYHVSRFIQCISGNDDLYSSLSCSPLGGAAGELLSLP